MILAAGQVYFRDLDNFLPYFLRIWLYTTPILYYANEVPARYKWVLDANPIGKLFTAWSDVIIEGVAPTYRGIAARRRVGGRAVHRRVAVLPLAGA